MFRIRSGSDDAVLLHEYVHHLQEMHPDVEGLVYAFHRGRKRGKRSGLDTGPADWNAANPQRTYAFMDYADREYGTYGRHTGGSVIAGIEARARGALKKAAANVDAEGLWGNPLEVLTTTLEVMLGSSPSDKGRLKKLIEDDPELFDFVLGLLLGYGGP